MKLTEDRAFADPDKAARRLMDHARGFEPVQDGRIYFEVLNGAFLFQDRGTPAEYSAGLALAIERAWASDHGVGRELWLFGSSANGPARPDSDVDLAIVLRPDAAGDFGNALGVNFALSDA